MGNWLGNLFGGAPTNAATAIGPLQQQLTGGQIGNLQYPIFPGSSSSATSSWPFQAVVFSHEQLLEQHFTKLMFEKKFAEWVREKKRRDVNAAAPGYFEPVPGCACAWCQLSKLEREVAIAKASEP